MQKGIVMEMASDYMIVMTKDGQFLKIPQEQRSCRVGEEILLTPPGFRMKKPLLAYFSAIAAAVIFCIVAFVGLSDVFEQPLPVVAYVSIDINPSLEVGIDEKEVVREIRGLNLDGNNLAAAVSEYKGKPLLQFTEKVLEKAEAYLTKGEGDIVISSTVIVDQAKIADTKISEEVKNVVSKHIAKVKRGKADEISVTALSTPPDVRKKALSEGLSAGKYAIYLNAKSNGADVTLDQFQAQSIHNLAKQSGGIGKLINPEKLPSKDKLKQLLLKEDDKDEKADSPAGSRKSDKAGTGTNSGKGDKKDDKKDNKKDDKKTGMPGRNETAKNDKNNKNENKNAGDKKNEHKKTNEHNKVTTPKIPEVPGISPGDRKVKENAVNEKLKDQARKDSNDEKEKKKQDDKKSLPPADELRRPEKPNVPDKPNNPDTPGKPEDLDRERETKKQELKKRDELQLPEDGQRSGDNER